MPSIDLPRPPALLLLLVGATLSATIPAQEPPAEARFAPERGFGMGPQVDSNLVARATAATPAVPPGPFTADWGSIREHYRVPEWFRDGKFGIFIHWGLYSVPAYHNEWYQKYMYGNGRIRDWHIKNYGPLDEFGYINFADQFAVKFDPDAWAELFHEAGAAYVIPTAEHHDWFSLWNSQVSKWNSVALGPKRDLVGELAKAVRKKGLKFGVSNHSIEHYTFINQRPPNGMKSDLDDPALADFYWVNHNEANLQRFLELWILKNYELIDQYQPDMLWFDNGINHRLYDPMKLKLAAYYYNRAADWKKEVSISTKSQAYLAGSILDFERQSRAPKELTSHVWQADDPIGPTFGYTTADRGSGDRTRDMGVTNPRGLIHRLIINISRNGNYLLNISPRGDGTIPENQTAVLRAIGAWLKVNGEAVYKTRPWIKSEEGKTHFTRNSNTLYVLTLDWPDKELALTSLGTKVGKVGKVELLSGAGPQAVEFAQDETALKLTPPKARSGEHAFAFRITGLQLK